MVHGAWGIGNLIFSTCTLPGKYRPSDQIMLLQPWQRRFCYKKNMPSRGDRLSLSDCSRNLPPIKDMPVETIVLLAALIVSWLVFTALLRVAKTTFSTAIAIAAIVFVLHLLFGIGPQQLWQQIIQLPQTLWHLIFGR
jgi:hypothetical protein